MQIQPNNTNLRLPTEIRERLEVEKLWAENVLLICAIGIALLLTNNRIPPVFNFFLVPFLLAGHDRLIKVRNIRAILTNPQTPDIRNRTGEVDEWKLRETIQCGTWRPGARVFRAIALLAGYNPLNEHVIYGN
jgi:hypothetical protein